VEEILISDTMPGMIREFPKAAPSTNKLRQCEVKPLWKSIKFQMFDAWTVVFDSCEQGRRLDSCENVRDEVKMESRDCGLKYEACDFHAVRIIRKKQLKKIA